MPIADHLLLLARYNSWMNDRIYRTASEMTPEALAEDRGAFFGSVIGTLNHLVVADITWLRRFLDAGLVTDGALAADINALPRPARLDAVLEPDLARLETLRLSLDAALERLVLSLPDAAMEDQLVYRRLNGEEMRTRVDQTLLHVFNHQTHHRGQVTTLFSQAGLDVGVTDLVAFARG